VADQPADFGGQVERLRKALEDIRSSANASLGMWDVMNELGKRQRMAAIFELADKALKEAQ
jgi:hypothetical protein